MNIFLSIVCLVLVLLMLGSGIYLIIVTWAGEGERAFVKFIIAGVLISGAIVIFCVCKAVDKNSKAKEAYSEQIRVYEIIKESHILDLDNCLIVSQQGDDFFSWHGVTEMYSMIEIKDCEIKTGFDEWKKLRETKPTIGELRTLFGFDYSKIEVYDSSFSSIIPENTFIYIFNGRT